MSEELKTVLSMVGTLLLMVAVFVGAYYASKFIGKKYNGGSGASAAGNIEILDRTVLGRDQYLLLVRVAGKIYLLGVAQHQITKIEEVDPEAVSFKEQTPKGGTDFMNVLKDAFQKQKLK